jgi:hypothetical protein
LGAVEEYFSLDSFRTYPEEETERPEPVTMDQQQYPSPNQKERLCSTKIESQSHPTPARNV